MKHRLVAWCGAGSLCRLEACTNDSSSGVMCHRIAGSCCFLTTIELATQALPQQPNTSRVALKAREDLQHDSMLIKSDAWSIGLLFRNLAPGREWFAGRLTFPPGAARNRCLKNMDETAQVGNIGHGQVVTSSECGPRLVERQEPISIAKESILISGHLPSRNMRFIR